MYFLYIHIWSAFDLPQTHVCILAREINIERKTNSSSHNSVRLVRFCEYIEETDIIVLLFLSEKWYRTWGPWYKMLSLNKIFGSKHLNLFSFRYYWYRKLSISVGTGWYWDPHCQVKHTLALFSEMKNYILWKKKSNSQWTRISEKS